VTRPAIIEAHGVSKRYLLGGAEDRTLRELVMDTVKAPGRWLRRARGGESEGRRHRDKPFWALEDVSFSIGQGEAVGIIGRNGAGKSTLLKILSRITTPTRGEVRLRGQVASLLEVGTGFHPELTGRENIYLNGAIMGMRRADIRARFDEIVAFSEVEEFLDTPVKRYSSGMYVRLAFAVAAHLEPDVLVVDEVLAVGDASFQKKCLGKMQNVASGGRTVLFVSHNMAALSRLCARALLLEHGRLRADGPVADVVRQYMSGDLGDSPISVDFVQRGQLPGDDDVRLLATRVVSEGMTAAQVDIRRPVRIEIEYEVLRQRYPMHPNIHIYTDESVCALVSSDAYDPAARQPRPPGRYRATVELPGNFLSEGLYSIDIAISTLDPVIVHVQERGLLSFHVHDPGEGDTARGYYGGPIPGVVRPLLPWRSEQLTGSSVAAGATANGRHNGHLEEGAA
jgi:lipopolysaccharide transport system ATP-binding protein